MLLSVNAFSQQKFSQKLEWKGDRNVLEYKVEIQNTGTGKSQFIKTEKNFVSLSLEPGKYRYKVQAYNLLGQKSVESSWINFEVLKAAQPVIEKPVKEASIAKDSEKLELDVSVNDVSKDSVVELVNQKTGEKIKGELVLDKKPASKSEVAQAKKIQFDKVKEGEWKLKITNPSGLKTESGDIKITAKAPEKKEPEKKSEPVPERKREPQPQPEPVPEPQPEVPVKEAVAVVQPEVKEEKPLPPAEDVKVKPQEEEPQTAAEEKENQDENESKEKKSSEKKKKRVKIFSMGVASGLVTSPYGGLVSYTEDYLIPSVALKAGILPVRGDIWKFGLEGSVSFWQLDDSNSYYDLTLTMVKLQADFIVRHKLKFDSLDLKAKLGYGVFYTTKDVSYSDTSVTQPDNETFGSKYVSAGIALAWTPMRFCYLEAGVDASFMLDDSAMLAIPYLGMGVRF